MRQRFEQQYCLETMPIGEIESRSLGKEQT